MKTLLYEGFRNNCFKDKRILMTNQAQSSIHDPHTTISNEEMCLKNAEAKASELPKNLKEMFPLYFMHGDIICMFISSTTQ